MKDPAFIQKMIQSGAQAKERVLSEIAILSPGQLNWLPPNNNWSIAQCLEHLIIADGFRIQIIEKKINRNFHSGTWARINPLKSFWGIMLVSQSQEKINKKIKTPRRFRPSTIEIIEEIQFKYESHLETLLQKINDCSDADIDNVFVKSPVSGLVSYSLRNAIALIIGHERRHINQAIRVKNQEGFPTQ